MQQCQNIKILIEVFISKKKKNNKNFKILKIAFENFNFSHLPVGCASNTGVSISPVPNSNIILFKSTVPSSSCRERLAAVNGATGFETRFDVCWFEFDGFSVKFDDFSVKFDDFSFEFDDFSFK